MAEPIFRTPQLTVDTVTRTNDAHKRFFPGIDLGKNVHCIELYGQLHSPAAQQVLSGALSRIAAQEHSDNCVSFLGGEHSLEPGAFAAAVLIERPIGIDAVKDVKGALFGRALKQALAKLAGTPETELRTHAQSA